MKIVVLSDNRTQSEALQPEHGLCIYLETNKYTCLLDTGASDLFIHNAEKTGVDIQAVDFVFISMIPPANSPGKSGEAVLLITKLSSILAGKISNEKAFLSGSVLGSGEPFK